MARTNADKQLEALLSLVEVVAWKVNPPEQWADGELLAALNSNEPTTRSGAVRVLQSRNKTWAVVKPRPRSARYLILVEETLKAYDFAASQPRFSRTEWGKEKYPIMSFNEIFKVRLAYSSWDGQRLAEGDEWLDIPEDVRMLPHIARLQFPQLYSSWVIDGYGVLNELGGKALPELRNDRRWGEIVRWIERNGSDQEEVIAQAKRLLYTDWSMDFKFGAVQTPAINLNNVPSGHHVDISYYTPLRELMASFLSIGDLKQVCEYIPDDNGFVDHENIPYEDKSSFIRGLWDYCRRRGKIRELVLALSRVNPSVDWVRPFSTSQRG